MHSDSGLVQIRVYTGTEYWDILAMEYSSTHHKYDESKAEDFDDSGYDTDPESDSEEEDKEHKQKSSK